MTTVSTIGVLGGMGPEATNHMASLITALTPARRDQEHIPVITFNNAVIPSRVEAILDGSASPLPELIRTARVLESAGADFMVMPCNTAHHYINEIADAISIPILHMVALTVSELFSRRYVRVGLLATTATLSTGLYHRRLQENGIAVVEPNRHDQHEVMQAIFGGTGIKAGFTEQASRRLEAVGQRLIKEGAQVILAGCSEVSVAFYNHTFNSRFDYVDPMLVTAQSAVSLAFQGYGAGCLSKVRKKNERLHVVELAREPGMHQA